MYDNDIICRKGSENVDKAQNNVKKSQAIVKQASILALAGILVRIIGVLYRAPLTAMIGDTGNGLYSTAYNIYTLVLLISSYSIPQAISKLISEKLAIKEYDNAHKIFHCALIYITVVAGVAALLTFFLAPLIVTKDAVFALRILCPTIFLSGFVGVLRGYFQAYATTVYTSISQIIEQIFNAIVSVLAAYIFIQPYLHSDPAKVASHGAGGSALGTGAGVMIALCFMFFVYITKGRKMLDERDGSKRVDSNYTIYRSILSIVTPIILSTCVYNLVTVVDMTIYYRIMAMRGMAHETVVALYGVYAGKYNVLMNVPVALASAMSTATIPAVSGAYARRDLRGVKANMTTSISVTMLILIPSAVGMAVLSYPIMGLLFPQKETIHLASTALKIGAPAIVFYGLSTVSNGILQAIGEVKVPLRNAVVALLCHIVIILLIMFLVPASFLNVAPYLLAIGTMLYALQMCIMNQMALRRIVGFRQNIRRIFLIPAIAAALMGVCAYGSYYLLFHLFRRVFIPLLASIGVGVVVYFILIIFFYHNHLELLDALPGMSKITRRLK